MSSGTGKQQISITVDEELVEKIKDAPGVKISTLMNDLGWNWAEERGYKGN